MARQSGSGDANEALELFLDTISNTFGGVLFIALLVCIMIQMTGNRPGTIEGPDAPVEAMKLKAQLKAMEEEMAGLMAELQRQTGKIQDLGGESELAREYADLSAQEQKLNAQHIKVTTQVTEIEGQINVLKEKLRGLARQKDDLENQRPELVAQVEAAKKRDAYKIRLPEAHTPPPNQVAVLLSGRRMAFAFQYDKQGQRVGHNTTCVKISADKSRMYPIAGQGIGVADSDAFRTALRSQLQKFNNKQHYMVVAVWPDSYREFEILRDAVTRLGFEYGLLLLAEGDAVLLGKGDVPAL